MLQSVPSQPITTSTSINTDSNSGAMARGIPVFAAVNGYAQAIIVKPDAMASGAGSDVMHPSNGGS